MKKKYNKMTREIFDKRNFQPDTNPNAYFPWEDVISCFDSRLGKHKNNFIYKFRLRRPETEEAI